MRTKDKTIASAMIGYAIGTENDAVEMYNYLIKHLPSDFAPVLKHIREEEIEHREELIKLLNKANDNS